jgi:cell division protein FtsQ
MAKQRQRKHKKKQRRSRGRLAKIYQFLSAVLIVAAIVAGCIVFFKVQEISVSGNSRYTAEEIISATGIQIEDNLYLLNKFDIRAKVLQELPYIQDMTIRRRLPDTILITVEESAPVAAISDSGQWWLMDGEGKLLEQSSGRGSAMAVYGLTPLVPSVGGHLAVDEEQSLRYQAMMSILEQLEKYDLLDRIDSMDLTSDTEVIMSMDDGRFGVEVPMVCDFERKFRMWSSALDSDRLTETDQGMWNLTLEDSVNLIPW